MGTNTINCNNCDSSKEEINYELSLSDNGINEKDPEKRRIIILAKSNFEQKISKMGTFIKNQKIRHILDLVNTIVNTISMPDDILKNKKLNTFEEPIIISLSPVVFLTEINSSSSLRLIAILPLFLILSNSDRSVRLVKPFLVTNTKFL